MTESEFNDLVSFHRYTPDGAVSYDTSDMPTASYVAEFRKVVMKRVPYVLSLDGVYVDELEGELKLRMWEEMVKLDIREETDVADLCDGGSCKVVCENCLTRDKREVALRFGTNYCPVCGRRIRWTNA